MRNLKNLGKKLLFNIVPYVMIIICVILIGYFGISEAKRQTAAEEAKYLKYKQEQDSLQQVYKEHMDSLRTANFELEAKLMNTNHKLDSITTEQKKINEAYEKEINDLSNATLSDHAEWFYSKLDSIRQYYGVE